MGGDPRDDGTQVRVLFIEIYFTDVSFGSIWQIYAEPRNSKNLKFVKNYKFKTIL